MIQAKRRGGMVEVRRTVGTRQERFDVHESELEELIEELAAVALNRPRM